MTTPLEELDPDWRLSESELQHIEDQRVQQTEERLGYKCQNNVPAICQAVNYPCDDCRDWKPICNNNAKRG